VLPLLAGQVFHLNLHTSALTYILAFGVAKAATNYVAGTLSDRYGRKPVPDAAVRLDVHPFSVQKRQQLAAQRIVTDRREVPDLEVVPRRRRGIRRCCRCRRRIRASVCRRRGG
jgi:hypothetical protein